MTGPPPPRVRVVLFAALLLFVPWLSAKLLAGKPLDEAREWKLVAVTVFLLTTAAGTVLAARGVWLRGFSNKHEFGLLVALGALGGGLLARHPPEGLLEAAAFGVFVGGAGVELLWALIQLSRQRRASRQSADPSDRAVERSL